MSEKDVHYNSTSRIPSRHSTPASCAQTLAKPVRPAGVSTFFLFIQAAPTVLSTHADQTNACYCLALSVLSGLTMVLTDFLPGIPRGVACCDYVYLPLFPRWSVTTAPKPDGFTVHGRRCRSCVICSCSKDCKFVSRATMHARRADKGICLKVRSRCRSRW